MAPAGGSSHRRPTPRTDVEFYIDHLEAELHRVLADPAREDLALIALAEWCGAGDPAAPVSSGAGPSPVGASPGQE